MTSDKRQPFVYEDLPESQNVADRRGQPEPQTLQEHIDRAQREPQPERGPPDVDSDLAKSLGAHQVASGRYGVVGLLTAFFAMLGKGRG